MDQTLNKNTRLAWIDIAKGIAIICTIIGHTVSYGSKVRNLIFSFHMPLFFLLAGYTMKSIPLEQIPSATKKDFKRLIIPVFIMRGINILMMVFIDKESVISALWQNAKTILWGNGNDYELIIPKLSVEMQGVGVLWFLIALFWGKLAYRIFDNKVKNCRFVLLLMFSLIGMLMGAIVRFPQCVDMIPLIMLFMELGRFLRNDVDMSSKKWMLTGVLAFFIWSYFVCEKELYIEIATRQYPLLLVSALIACLGCVVAIQFSQAIENSKVSKVIINIGRNSLDLLCIHHIDEYFETFWRINAISDKSYEMTSSLLRVIIDILILIFWIYVKKGVNSIDKKISFSGSN